jgi:hypothetical protein
MAADEETMPREVLILSFTNALLHQSTRVFIGEVISILRFRRLTKQTKKKREFSFTTSRILRTSCPDDPLIVSSLISNRTSSSVQEIIA